MTARAASGRMGSARASWLAAKRHYDPDEILTPGYDIF